MLIDPQTDAATWCTVDRTGNTLVLMDTDGVVLDIHEMSPQRGGRRRAKRQLRRWQDLALFNYAEALNLI